MFDMFKFNKQKYKAWFFIKEGLTYRYQKKKKFHPNPKKPLIKYKGKPYDVDIDNPTYRKGLTSHFFIETDGQQILTILNETSDTTIKELLYMDESIKQVYKAIKQPKLKITWISLLLSIGIGLLIGWIIGTFLPISMTTMVNGG